MDAFFFYIQPKKHDYTLLVDYVKTLPYFETILQNNKDTWLPSLLKLNRLTTSLTDEERREFIPGLRLFSQNICTRRLFYFIDCRQCNCDG